MQEFITACPRNCYSTCSFRAITENGKLVKIEADPSNRAVPEGPCLKGLSYVERVYSEKRILYPLRRTSSGFERISWDKALDEIAGNLMSIKAGPGTQAVLFYASSGMSGLINEVSLNFWKLYGGTTRVYGNLCWPAGLEAERLTLGENKHNSPWDLENAGLIILWGKNPAECNIQQMIPVEKAQRKGARLVVIDPRRTPSAERADILIQPKNGSDGILALAMAKHIVEKGLHDKDFIQKRVLGFREFEKMLHTFSFSEASESCGVPESMIKEVAEMIAQIKPMTLIAGYGMQRYSNGGQTTRCLLSLPVITGNIGIRGGGWQYANLQSYIFDDVKEPCSYYPSAEIDLPFRRSIPTALLGEAMLNTQNPELEMIWVERGNPLSQNPDSGKIYEAFKKLRFRVVAEQFMTDTARLADIILPAKSMFEQSDIIGSYWNPYVSLKQKILDAPGEVRPESEIYYLLARKLGFRESDIQNLLPFEPGGDVGAWLGKKLEKYPSLSIEQLKAGPQIAPGNQEIAYEDLFFNTPSGKIELYSEQASQKWGVNPLPAWVPLQSDLQFPLCLMSPNTKNRIHSQFGNLEVIKMIDPGPHACMSSKDARERGINNGDKARIFNKLGELFMKIIIDHSLRPGTLVIYNGYWNSEESCPNVLTKGRLTDMGYGAAFHDTRVEAEKI